MKKLSIFFAALFTTFSFALLDVQNSHSVDPQVAIELDAQMEILVNALNASDGTALSSLMGSNATDAVKEIPMRLKGNKIEYIIGNPSYESLDNQQIKSTWKVSSTSTGINGNVSITGLSHNAVFEKQGNDWRIVDGSFDPTSLAGF